MVNFKIYPGLTSMSDSPLRIMLENCPPNCYMTLRASLQHKSGTFETHAIYKTGPNGTLNLDEPGQKSLGGKYLGNHPMGLLCCVTPSPGSRKGSRFLPRDVRDPVEISLQAYKGWIEDHSQLVSSPAISSTVLQRVILQDQVQRVEIRKGKLRGTLFIPDGEGPFPAVLDLFGTGGGLREDRSALLASHGIMSFALAYFNFDDLPKDLKNPFEMEYFLEAVDFVANHPKANSGGVGVIGVSTGADIACFLAAYSNKVKCVIPINGYHMLDGFNKINYNGQPIKSVDMDPNTYELLNGDTLIYKTARDAVPFDHESIIPIELSPLQAKFLFFASLDDPSTCSLKSAQILMDRLESKGLGANAELMTFEGAGHLLEPAYTPVCALTYHKHIGVYSMYGGKPDEHSRAQEKSWKRTIEFFKNNLSSQNSVTHGSLARTG